MILKKLRLSTFTSQCNMKAYLKWFAGPEKRGIQPVGFQNQSWNTGIYAHIRATTRSRDQAERIFYEENPSLCLDPLQTDRFEAVVEAGLTRAFLENDPQREIEVTADGWPLVIHPDHLYINQFNRKVVSYAEFKTTTTQRMFAHTEEKYKASLQLRVAAEMMQPKRITVHVWALPMNKPGKETTEQYIKKLVGLIREEPGKYYKRFEFAPSELLPLPLKDMNAQAKRLQEALLPSDQFRIERDVRCCWGEFSSCPYMGYCFGNLSLDGPEWESRPLSAQDKAHRRIHFKADKTFEEIRNAKM